DEPLCPRSARAIELYDEMPPVAICRRCDRLFVPQRKGEKCCRRYIWPAGGGENIAGCVYDDDPTRARSSTAMHGGTNTRSCRCRRTARTRSSYESCDHKESATPVRGVEEGESSCTGRLPTPMRPDLLPQT